MGDHADDLYDIALNEEGDYLRERQRHHRSRLLQTRIFFLDDHTFPLFYTKRDKHMATKPERLSIKTPEFRGSYVWLATPRPAKKREDGTPGKSKYEMLAVFDKKKKSSKIFIEELTKILVACGVEAHGAKILKKPDGTPRSPKFAFKHWPIKDGDKGENEAHHGHWLINIASNFKPSVIDKNGDELTAADDLYSGAWYKAKISPWAWNNELSGKGVSVNLESAIKIRDDKRFGGGSDAAEDFADDVAADDDADDDSDVTG